ncbi:MAG TPA: metal-dependent hydrolase [Terriglobia bacterium]|nr:metal-dependent hydrolase [Terriglobia bacterium]
MFIGHIAVALGAKKAAPKTSLGTLLLAAQWPDIIWPLFLALGWEKVEIVPGSTAVSPLDFTRYPLSHSLLAVLGWAMLLAGAYLIFRKNLRGAFWVGFCVMSHWLLDALSHRPDLPLYPGSDTLVGVGLWNSVSGTLLVEGTMFVVAVVLYSQCTQPRDKTGEYSFRLFVGLLVFLYLMGLVGPPPPSVGAIETAGFLSWLFIPWAYWIDRHRTAKDLHPVLSS